MLKFLDKNKVISTKQIGFRTNTSAVRISKRLEFLTPDQKQQASACFIDLNKAFDTIDQKNFVTKTWNVVAFEVNF